jgi:hypothetical protein
MLSGLDDALQRYSLMAGWPRMVNVTISTSVMPSIPGRDKRAA